MEVITAPTGRPFMEEKERKITEENKRKKKILKK